MRKRNFLFKENKTEKNRPLVRSNSDNIRKYNNKSRKFNNLNVSDNENIILESLLILSVD